MRGEAVDAHRQVRAVVLQGADRDVGERRLLAQPLQGGGRQALVAALDEVRRHLEELDADAVRVAQVGDLRALVRPAVELHRAARVDRPGPAVDGVAPGRVGVLDAEAEVDVARVPGVVRVRHAVREPVVEQLQDHAAGEVDERGVDLHAREAEDLAEVGPIEHRLEAAGAAQEGLPERQRPVEVGDRRTDVEQPVRA